MNLKRVLLPLALVITTLFAGMTARATTCPNATAISPTSLPIVNQSLACGTNNDILFSNTVQVCGNGGYLDGKEALYTYTPTANLTVTVSFNGTANSIRDPSIFIFSGCPTTTGTLCLGSVAAPNFATTASIVFNATAGATYYILFDKNGYHGFDVCPGTFSMSAVPAAPTCAPPTAVSVSGITTMGASISWTAPTVAPASGYQYEVRTAGAAGSGAAGLAVSGSVVSGTNTTVSGLSPLVSYSVYVRSNCGSGVFSTWSAATTFTTLCAPPSITGTTPATRCGPGTLSLAATGTGSNIFWYANNTSDSVIATGSPFVTPALTATTTYYAAASNGASYTGLGKTSPPGSTANTDIYYGITVTTTQAFTLNTAQLFSATVGLIQGSAVLIDSATGATVTTTPFTFTGTATPQFFTMNLNWALEANKTYFLRAGFTTGRGIADFPTDYNSPVYNNLSPVGKITSGNYAGGNVDIYYINFYNISITANCVSPRTAVVATVKTPPVITASAMPATICEGNSTTLSAASSNAGYTYSWSPATTPATGASVTAAPATTTRYFVNAVDNTSGANAGCMAKDSITVTVNPRPAVPTVTPATAMSICLGDTVNLSSTGAGGPLGTTIAWTATPAIGAGVPAGAGTSSASNGTLKAVPTVAGTYAYTALLTTSNGCSRSATTASVTVSAKPTVNLGNDTSICIGNSITFNAGNTGSTYLWSTGSTTQTITASTAGNYSVRVTNAGGCIGRDTVVLTLKPLPVVALGNDTSICIGNAVTFNAGNAGSTYLWSNGATTQTIMASAAGNYSVRVTNTNGCIGRDTVVLSLNPLPVVNLGPDVAFCAGSSATLNAGNAGASYLWSTGATTQSILVSTAGSFAVRVTNSNGCIGRDTLMTTVNPLPVVNLGNDTSICIGSSVTFNAGNTGASYLWNTGATTSTITASAAGNYSVRVTNVNGCIGRDTIMLSLDPLPVVFLGNDTAICVGNSITFNAGNAGASYLWSTGATTATITASAAGNYSVRVTNTNGCIGRDTIVLSLNPLPVVNLGNDTSFCFGNAVTLNAGNAGTSYLWSTGATTQSILVSTAGSFAVRVTNSNGCIGVDTLVTTVNPLPVVFLGNDTAICVGNSITFNAGNAGASYLWSTGAATQTTTVSAGGTYSVRVTNANGCISSDTINLSLNPLPVVNLGNDTAFCIGGVATLNAGNAGSSYLWSTGATTQTVLAATTGSYAVRVTNGNGCVGRDTVNVTVNPSPVVTLGPDRNFCAGNSVILDAGNAGATYLWSSGATTQTINVAGSGTFSVRVINSFTCVGRDTVNVTVRPKPVAGNITVSGQSPTFSFVAMDSQSDSLRGWLFGDGTSSLNAPQSGVTHTYMQPGTYKVKFYVANSCGVDTSTKTVVVTTVGVQHVMLDEDVSLFPNPASNYFIVQNNSAQKLKTITVLNVVGAVVQEVKADNPKEQRIAIEGLAAGSYLVRITLDGTTVIRRLQITQ